MNGDSFWNKYYEDNVNLIAEHVPIASRQSNKIMVEKAMFKKWGLKTK